MVSTITSFYSRFNSYKNGTRKVSKVYPKKCNVYQEQFHRHFNSEGHNGMEDWKITIIDRTENVLELKRRERERERERVTGNTALIDLFLMS